jgi:antitoxin component YwqK of YwqJK toxin-antitoxin module
MRLTLLLIVTALATLFSSCTPRNKAADDSSLISIQVIDRNGFAETISNKDRLARYQKTDFTEPQSYEKVLRVFGKSEDGKTPSVMTSYHSNGYIHQYLDISNGRAHGLYREWHFNGTEKMKLHVIEGAPELSDAAVKSWVFDGVNKVWDENGNLIAEIPYEIGVLQGTSFYYYPSGQIKKQVPYVQDEVHGLLICYRENGEIEETIPHEKGLRNGKASSFFPNSVLAYEETFENGLLVEGVYYAENGEILSKIEDGNGKRSERENDHLKRLVQYQKGLPEGLVECFDEKGQLRVAFHQENGKKQGEEWEYYPTKSKSDPLKPKILLNWQEDALQGMVKTWFPDGKQESQKEMYQNKKSGVAYAWYRNGDLMLYEEYEKDDLSSGTYYKKGDKQPISRVSLGRGTATLYHPDGYLLQKISYEKGVPSLNYDTTK